MRIRVRDIISYLGRDYVVEAVLTYDLGRKTRRMYRATDGRKIIWVEPSPHEERDRLLIMREVKDLAMVAPPPQSISYKGHSYLPRWQGRADVTVAGKVHDRVSGSCQIWRYRAAGDRYLQIEDWPDKVIALAGESVHKGMIDVLPAK